jgi:hypothetical protein
MIDEKGYPAMEIKNFENHDFDLVVATPSPVCNISTETTSPENNKLIKACPVS